MPRTERDYTVGWICALPIELAAAEAILDEKHDTLYIANRRKNIYKFGRVGDHNVVIATLPLGRMGTTPAAVVAGEMYSSFSNLKFGLMVGVGAGVPGGVNGKDVRLGDVVVGTPENGYGGVIQYDFGKNLGDGKFLRTGSLDKAPATLLIALSGVKSKHPAILTSGLFQEAVKIAQQDDRFNYPGQDTDRFYQTGSKHIKSNEDTNEDECHLCDPNQIVDRPPRPTDSPTIHYGTIACGNQVVRDAEMRDRLSKETGIICFEMESGGLVDDFPCLVVRGICDYADNHKNKRWQPYAAATAALFAKAVLKEIPGAVSNTADSIGVGNTVHRIEGNPISYTVNEGARNFNGNFNTSGGKVFSGNTFNSGGGDMNF